MKYYQIIFSPTGGTEKVAKAMTRSWPQSSSAIHFFMCFSSFCHAARLRGRFMMRVALLYLTLPPDFQATDAIWGGRPKRQFSFAILCLQPKHRGKALPLCPAKRNRPTAQRFDAISCRAGAQSPRRPNARASRSIPGSVTAAPPSASPFPAGTERGVSAVHLPSASVGPGDFLPFLRPLRRCAVSFAPGQWCFLMRSARGANGIPPRSICPLPSSRARRYNGPSKMGSCAPVPDG